MKSKILTWSAASLFSVLILSDLSFSEDWSAWNRSNNVRFTSAGASAVIINLNESTFSFTSAKGDGSDLRFSRPDGTTMEHEIESWNSADNTAKVKVKLTSADTSHIVMHWGNASAGSSSQDLSDITNTVTGYFEL